MACDEKRKRKHTRVGCACCCRELIAFAHRHAQPLRTQCAHTTRAPREMGVVDGYQVQRYIYYEGREERNTRKREKGGY